MLVSSLRALEKKPGEGIKPHYIFFPHWSWLVPQKIYDNHECICFHMTDVPYGRGGSPLQNLIIRGHDSTKLTALRMIDELDADPVYLQTSLSLHGSAQEIFEGVAALCYHLIEKIIEEEAAPVVQQGKVTHFKRRTPEESELPLQLTSSNLYDFIHMLDAESYPKAFINHGEYWLEFTQVDCLENEVTAKVTFKRQVDS